MGMVTSLSLRFTEDLKDNGWKVLQRECPAHVKHDIKLLLLLLCCYHYHYTITIIIVTIMLVGMPVSLCGKISISRPLETGL